MELENKTFTQTTNGEKAYSKQHFLETDEKALVGLNISITTKDDFETALPYLKAIFEGSNHLIKVYALVLIAHIRDIEHGKGLRKPFLKALLYLYQNGFSNFVDEFIKMIPQYGYYKDLCNLHKMAEKKQLETLKEKTCDFYANELQREYKTQEGKKLTHAGKFAPRQQKKFHSFAVDLASKMFPESKTQLKEYRAHLQNIMKKYAQITEVLMSARRWDEIDPKYVPSLCFQQYKKCFLKGEQTEEKRKILKQKYEEHIKNALEGKKGAKINAKRLTVDKIVNQFQSEHDELQINALEAQMLDIVADMKKGAHLLQDCVAVCDVSGSMTGTPMDGCLGLGVIINELNKESKFPHSLITFSSDPTWIKLGDAMTFKEKFHTLRSAPWGMNTDFYKAMKLIAEEAQQCGHIPKIMFVFSDMQFDCACTESWETGYERIVSLYKQKGFTEDQIPTIVFWNLREGTSNFAVDAHQKRVLCISGFSQSLLKAITTAPDLEYIMKLSPFTFLIEILESERYMKVKQLAMQLLN